MTPEWKQHLSSYRFVAELLKEVSIGIGEVREICKIDSVEESFKHAEILGEDIEANFEERGCRRGCCGQESSCIVFPTSYLWTENYRQLEEHDRQTFLRLKKKFELKPEPGC